MTVSGTAGYQGITQVNQGTLAVDMTGSIPNSILNVNGGTLSFTAQTGGTAPLARTVAGINLNGGTVVLAPTALPQNADQSVLVVTSSLSISSGQLDLTSNDMVIKGTTADAVQSLLKMGFNAGGGYWNGPTGIVSTTAANNSQALTTLGYRTGGNLFDGVTTGTGDVLVKYTYYGDATLDGSVDGADYQQIDLGFGSGATGWSNGDFNYDGVVDGSDFALIDNTFNQIAARNSAALLAIVARPTDLIAVPEPGIWGLIGIGLVGMLGQRRRGIRVQRYPQTPMSG